MDKKHPDKSIRQRALEYLAKREYSVAELSQKLKIFANENDDIPKLIDELVERGWLSDARFAGQVVHARQKKFGRRRIEQELRDKGVSDHEVDAALEQLAEDDRARAYAVWKKKFNAYPESREAWAKQARFLQSRGFDFDVIKHVLDSKWAHDNSIE